LLARQAEWLGMDTPERTEVDTAAGDDTVLQLGTSEFIVMETPGHTRGSMSVWIPDEKKVIAGDTLFRDSIGRTDLPGGNTRQILSSIKARMLELPDETVVFPGHGPTTTIGRERERNPFLQNL
jgi:hydroxyacylglutathione hydrolase